MSEDVKIGLMYGKDNISVVDLKIVSEGNIKYKQRGSYFRIPNFFAKWKDAKNIPPELIHPSKNVFYDGEYSGREMIFIEYDIANNIPNVFRGNLGYQKLISKLRTEIDSLTAENHDLKKRIYSISGDELLKKKILEDAKFNKKVRVEHTGDTGQNYWSPFNRRSFSSNLGNINQGSNDED